MPTFAERLEAVEDLADSGDLTGALSQLESMKPGLPPADSCQLHLQIASVTARLGKFSEAISELQTAEAFAIAAGRTDVALEVRVTRASIVAALGQYDDAIPMLAGVLSELEGHPELAQLRSDVKAELRGYRNLVSPKTAATWASLLT